MNLENRDRPAAFGTCLRMTLLIACVMLPSCKKGPDISTPKKAAVAFAKAAEAGDLDMLHQVATGTDAEFAMARDYGLEMQAMGRFIAAATAKFGDLGKDKDISLDLAAELENSDEKIEGDTAILTPKDSPSAAPHLLKKDGSRWKFDLSYLDKDDTARRTSLNMSQAVKVWDEAAQDIEYGKYRGFPQALGATRRKVNHILIGEVAAKLEDDKEKAREDIQMLDKGLRAYRAENGEWPSTSDGLSALVKQPSSAANWKGPYLDDAAIPLDPCNHPYLYEQPGTHNKDEFDLHSIGPDGQDGSGDDITNWTTVR